MATKKTGVLLANLGSPTAPTVPAVRRFLKDFLWDSRVVNIPRPVWWLILHGFVLPFRPARSAKAYQKIWSDKGSPLIYLTRQLSDNLADKLLKNNISTKYSMRYGEPSIASQLKLFKEEGINHVVVLPLYPQYSSTTTASIYDDVIKEFNQWRHLPSFKFI
jgi:protoporphyrin/coproporphyrin ferrochelatase